MTFKSFVAEEAASADHALKFLSYKSEQHSVLASRIRGYIVAKWVAMAEKIEPAKVEISDKLPIFNYWEKPNLKKKEPKKYTTVAVDKSSSVSKHGRRFKVGPVVRIGSSYSKEDKDSFKKDFMMTAKSLLQTLANKLNDGGDGPFHVSQRGHNQFDDVVFEFRTGSIAEAIFVIGADRGSIGDFVYFRDYVDRE
jgi:hypothetical protein